MTKGLGYTNRPAKSSSGARDGNAKGRATPKVATRSPYTNPAKGGGTSKRAAPNQSRKTFEKSP